ncbi:MAG: glycoside hydrolase family 88 protein [Dysgonamonadaceae bacterium]|nr:glycoside hydrolase family 88 protein [Dysgonamonadaceae bacterium]
MRKVADWQMSNFTYNASGSHDYGIAAWTHSTLYIGMLEWAKIAPNSNRCYDWLYDKGRKGNWTVASNFENNSTYQFYHADELCVGQFHIGMYKKYREENMIASIKERVDRIIANPPTNQSMTSGNKKLWTWCDALFMAPPVYAELSQLLDDNVYRVYMDTQYKRTYNRLFDPEEKLFFRDDSYFNKKEANGEKVFWGRGNGWAIAGTANILKALPKDSEYKEYYEDVFRQLALRLIELQNNDGSWHASLLDPDSYPAPETSASALITYALAYGLNNNLLTEEEAYKPVAKAWNKLCDAIHANGKLGYVQPVGQDPKTVTKDMTATFGVGAFLLAGTEIYHYLDSKTGIDLIEKEISSLEEFLSPETKIRIYTVQGQKVNEELLSNRNFITVLKEKNLPRGVYLINFQLNEKLKTINYIPSK